MSETKELKVRRLLQSFEHQIVEINKRNIREIAGEIDAERILRLAEAISVCRARYLKATLEMVTQSDGEVRIEIDDALIEQRRTYHEAMRGFDAVRHALERGYFALDDDA